MKGLKAIVLAGGKGTRLRPITYEIPKPLLPVKGKFVIVHLFDLFKKYGIRDVIISVGHLRNRVKEYLGDGKKFGVRLSYVEEKRPLGTAGPLRLAKPLLSKTFVCSNGDELKNINIREMVDFHRKRKASVTIALKRVKDPSSYGVARMKKDRIVEFVEKPRPEEAPSNLINAGFYVMEREIIDSYIPKRGFSMLEKDVFPKIAEDGKLFGFKFRGQWFDTGNFERYEVAIKKWKGIA